LNAVLPVTQEVAGSSPVTPATLFSNRYGYFQLIDNLLTPYQIGRVDELVDE